MERLAQGWTLRAACAELGIARATGQRWKNGFVVRGKGGTVKVVPPLDPLALRPVSSRFPSEEERIQIADLASNGARPTAILSLLGLSPSTISRELRRNAHTTGQYRPFHAHSLAATRRRRVRPLKLTVRPGLDAFVQSKLEERWSPQQIIRAPKTAHPNDPTMQLATESIYLAIYRPSSGLLRQYFPKSTNLAVHTPHDLPRVESELNRCPRITLGDRAPADLFALLLASEIHPPLR